MPTLYDHSRTLIDLVRFLDDENASDDTIRQAVQEYLRSDDLVTTVDAYCRSISEIEAEADVRKREADRLLKLSEAGSKKAGKLKEMLHWFLSEIAQVTRLRTALYDVSIVTAGGRQAIVAPEDPTMWPERFVTYIPKLDREAVRIALESGEQIDGFHLADRSKVLRIR